MRARLVEIIIRAVIIAVRLVIRKLCARPNQIPCSRADRPRASYARRSQGLAQSIFFAQVEHLNRETVLFPVQFF
jgi:hypothetical protein